MDDVSFETTTLSSGQRLDWVKIQVQATKIAKPPPPPGDVLKIKPSCSNAMPLGSDPVTELEMARNTSGESLRGPKGTVPVVSCKVRAGGSNSEVENPTFHTQRTHKKNDATHLYASSNQEIKSYGAQGRFSIFKPYVQGQDEFSLMQMALANTNLGYKQTIEAGWIVYPLLFGDNLPHLFTLFTTNGYQGSLVADNTMCYGASCRGWVQVDDTIYPGSTISTVSNDGGDQYELWLDFQLYEGNWWLWARDRWVGYYPSSLFSAGHGKTRKTLAEHATHVSFYGETVDTASSPGDTKTDMGSGQYPDSKWFHSAYIHNMRYQDQPSEIGSSSADYNPGRPYRQDPGYATEIHSMSGTNWGSYLWLGGPGADGKIGVNGKLVNSNVSAESVKDIIITSYRPAEVSEPRFRCVRKDERANGTAAMMKCSNNFGTQYFEPEFEDISGCMVNFTDKSDTEGVRSEAEFAMEVEKHGYNCLPANPTPSGSQWINGHDMKDILVITANQTVNPHDAKTTPFWQCSRLDEIADMSEAMSFCASHQGNAVDGEPNMCVIDAVKRTWAQTTWWASEYAMEVEKHGFKCKVVGLRSGGGRTTVPSPYLFTAATIAIAILSFGLY